MRFFLSALHSEFGAWTLATSGVAAYIAAAESGDYKTACLVLLGLLLAALGRERVQKKGE